MCKNYRVGMTSFLMPKLAIIISNCKKINKYKLNEERKKIEEKKDVSL